MLLRGHPRFRSLFEHGVADGHTFFANVGARVFAGRSDEFLHRVLRFVTERAAQHFLPCPCVSRHAPFVTYPRPSPCPGPPPRSTAPPSSRATGRSRSPRRSARWRPGPPIRLGRRRTATDAVSDLRTSSSQVRGGAAETARSVEAQAAAVDEMTRSIRSASRASADVQSLGGGGRRSGQQRRVDGPPDRRRDGPHQGRGRRRRRQGHRARRQGRADRRHRRDDRRHRRADEPAGVERGHRGGPGRRAGQGLRRRRGRGPQAGRALVAVPPRRSPT